MRTIILPGYSKHNRDWAYEVKKNLRLGHEVIVHEWEHWKDENLSFSLKKELDVILSEVGDDSVNILAKSVGTYVAMKLLSKIRSQVKKIILCGIPSVSEARKQIYLEALHGFSLNNIICFQNTNDPFASFREVKGFMKKINPKIKVIEMPRSDHNYPYYKNFQEFLRD